MQVQIVGYSAFVIAMPQLPDVGAVLEAGMPTLEAYAWGRIG